MIKPLLRGDPYDMIDPVFKKYFEAPIDDLENRKIKVWQKVYAHIRYEMGEARVPAGRQYGIIPLAVSLALVVLGITALNVFSHSLPGDKFYSVKRAVEKAQLASAPTPEVKSQLQLSFIEKRTEEIKKIETKAGGKLSASDRQKIDSVKAEVGQTAISLLNEEKGTSLVTTAEAKVVGEAVTEFLKSTALTGKEKEQKIKEVAAEALAATPPDVTPKTEDKPAAKPILETKTETKPAPGVIKGEVESNDIKVK